jgi:hypothetical protein
MTLAEIDAFFIQEIGLLVDPEERGSGRTYFWKKVSWRPSESTRVARVRWGSYDEIVSVQLCVSSDNNNSVLICAPFKRKDLRKAIMSEIELLGTLQRGSNVALYPVPFGVGEPTR